MESTDLFLLNGVFCSDDDADSAEDIYAGYDKELNLVVLLQHSDYVEPEYNCCAYAVVDKYEAYKLAKRLRVPMTRLPAAVSAPAEGYAHLVNPTLRQTRSCFNDILTFIADYGCRLRLLRTYGADGYTCF